VEAKGEEGNNYNVIRAGGWISVAGNDICPG